MHRFKWLGTLVLGGMLSACNAWDSSPSSSSSSGNVSTQGSPAVPVQAGQPGPGGAVSANLVWAAPTQNIDGTILTDLAGYYVRYGTSADTLNQIVSVAGAHQTSYQFTGLQTGATYYFSVTAYDATGRESEASETISKTI